MIDGKKHQQIQTKAEGELQNPCGSTYRSEIFPGIPLDDWLLGPLRHWAEALLDEARLRREGCFHPAPIRKLWDEHLSRRRNRQYHLWDVLMFQAWLENEKG